MTTVLPDAESGDDHGILNGCVQLLAWQVDGSGSRPLPNWLLMKVDYIADMHILPETFPEADPPLPANM